MLLSTSPYLHISCLQDFEARKKLLRERTNQKHSVPKQLASLGRDLSQYPLLQALASREELVRTGKLTTIVFIRDKNSKNQEVSGYIDLAHRMRTEDFTPVFECKKRLLPKPSDLSYFNWETNVSTSNSTPHYQVISLSSLYHCTIRILPKSIISLDDSLPSMQYLYQVIADSAQGLLFKNKRDRKIVNVNPESAPGDNRSVTRFTHTDDSPCH